MSVDMEKRRVSTRTTRYFQELQFVTGQLKSESQEYLDLATRAWNDHAQSLAEQGSSGVERLTLLATIFLPLSLSSALLAMNSRFRDLGPLLGDFLGTAILLGSFAILFIMIVNPLRATLGLATSEWHSVAYLGPLSYTRCLQILCLIAVLAVSSLTVLLMIGRGRSTEFIVVSITAVISIAVIFRVHFTMAYEYLVLKFNQKRETKRCGLV